MLSIKSEGDMVINFFFTINMYYLNELDPGNIYLGSTMQKALD